MLRLILSVHRNRMVNRVPNIDTARPRVSEGQIGVSDPLYGGSLREHDLHQIRQFGRLSLSVVGARHRDPAQLLRVNLVFEMGHSRRVDRLLDLEADAFWVDFPDQARPTAK